MRFCFVLLHYNVIEETINCIESIQRLEKYEDCSIVLVDNASPNGSGEILQNRYCNDQQIDVILLEKNEGFSKGNNEGCAYAIQKWRPDFLIVANNDIVFEQIDFCRRIEDEYVSSGFSILGPDIYNPNKGIHQSPIADNPPNLMEVNKVIFLNQIVMWLYPLVYPLYAYWYKLNEKNHNTEGYKERKENVCLMGAALVYSKKYFDKYDSIFYPATFFYYEEFIQSQRCRRNNELVVFEPSIRVMHLEGKSTASATSRSRYMQIKFRTKNMLDSARIYRKCLLVGEN